MTALDLFTRGRPALDHLELVEESQEPLARFDVGLGGMELPERRMAY
jgi:hypothetical protein